MVLGIGVDIVHLPRIAAILKRNSGQKFARRVLNSLELEQWSSIQGCDLQQQVHFLAVRWAVKEAAYKALYPIVKPTWKELCYRGLLQSGDKPSLTYTPLNSTSASKTGPMHVSVSHDGEYAVAYVMVEGRLSDGRLR